jgi:hypothetical protein
MGRIIWSFAAMVGVALGLALPTPALHLRDNTLFVAMSARGR